MINYLNKSINNQTPLILNLGIHEGYSVLDMVKAFEKVSNKSIPYEIVSRRAGNIATCLQIQQKQKRF